MDLKSETIHYRQPKEILRSLGKEARQQIDADEERLIAWRWAKDVIVPKLEAMLVELKAQMERAGERLAQAEGALAARELALREAQRQLERALDRSGVAPGSLEEQEGGADARFGTSEESQFADLELGVRDARRELQYVVTHRGTAQRTFQDAEHCVKDCQRLLTRFREMERPETPTLDLLWSLMDGARKADG
jgi:hypothetical protein